MKFDVTTIGDSMKDIFVFPAPDEMEKPKDGFLRLEYGDKITISDINYSIGGTACNVAVGLSKMGLKTALISAVGKDPDGEDIIKKLKKEGVSAEFLKTDKEKKTSFSIIISYKGERTILVFHSFGGEEFKIPPKLETEWIYLGPLGEGWEKLYWQLTSEIAQKNYKIAINPGAVQIKAGLKAMGGLLRVSKILFINKEEGQQLAGLSGVVQVKEITKVLKETGVETVVLTDGKEGAYAIAADNFLKVGAYPGERVESTGAGDSFASGFLGGIIEGQDLFTSLKWGVINAASVVGQVGAQAGLLSKTTIKRRVKEYRWPPSTLRFS